MNIRRLAKYVVLWLLGFAVGGVVVPLTLYLVQNPSLSFDLTSFESYINIYHQYTEGYKTLSIMLPFGLEFKWHYLWALLLVCLWYRQPLLVRATGQADTTSPGVRTRWMIYVLLWLAGFILMLPAPVELDNFEITVYASLFGSMIPALSIWTTLVFLVFLFIGDDSEMHRTLIASYWGVWAAFSLVLLATVLTGYVAFKAVQDRMLADQTVRELASSTLKQLSGSISELVARSENLASRVDGYQADLQYFNRRHEELPGIYTDAYLAKNVSASTQLLSEHLEIEIPRLKGLATSVQANTVSALNQLNLSVTQSATEQQIAVLKQISVVMSETVKVTASIPETIVEIDTAWSHIAAEQPTDQASQLSALSTKIQKDLNLPALTAKRMAGIAVMAADEVKDSGIIMFMWIAVLYSIFVLFPWIILLLFIYRKRFNRAAVIVNDLINLDPTYDLLTLVVIVNGGQSRHIARMSWNDRHDVYSEHEILESISYLRSHPGGLAAVGRYSSAQGDQKKMLDEMDKIIHKLAERTFSNFEFVLSLLFLSVLTAVGWYFVFYPNADIGLAQLIEQGAGIRDLTDHFVSNVSPLTLGFAGAYFFIMQMLLRRYLSNDLYPSAFLQAAVRLLVVFILSLLLSVLFGAEDPVWLATGAAVAFFAGVFPAKGLSLAATFVNRLLDKPDFFPQSLEKCPLTDLTGIDYWTEARLFEENLENIQGMATVEIQQLVIGTYYPTERIVNWIDESIFYLHAGKLCPRFQSVGINTASKLLNAAGYKPEDFMAAPGSEPTPTSDCVAWIVKAVEATSQETKGDATSASKITAEVVYEICKSIYPERNIKYIQNFYRSINYRDAYSSGPASRAVSSYETINPAGQPTLSPNGSNAMPTLEAAQAGGS